MTKPTDDQLRFITAITLKLAQLGLEVSFVEPITSGPIVTTYRFSPKAAAKVAQIVACADDLALALHVEDVLVRRLPGEGVIGINVPNLQRGSVLWRQLCQPPDNKLLLPLNLGVDIEGKPYRDDLTKLPHLLITGSTDGGKSTLMHCLIASLMLWRSPEQVQFVLSDTKKVEFGHFIGSPHLLFDPSKTMYETWERLDWIIEEVDRRLRLLERAGVRNIAAFNAVTLQLPYIIIVIDELFHVLGGDKRGEHKIATGKLARIVSESRAAGIHVIGGTQRSSVDIVSGGIKTNFPARLTFRLPSPEDSRTIIGHSGAEHLLSKGDMLYYSPNHPATQRLHSGYASTEDVKQCVEFTRHAWTKVKP